MPLQKLNGALTTSQTCLVSVWMLFMLSFAMFQASWHFPEDVYSVPDGPVSAVCHAVCTEHLQVLAGIPLTYSCCFLGKSWLVACLMCFESSVTMKMTLSVSWRLLPECQKMEVDVFSLSVSFFFIYLLMYLFEQQLSWLVLVY